MSPIEIPHGSDEVRARLPARLKAFALPERVVLPHVERLRMEGIVFRRRTVHVAPYRLPAVLFAVPKGEEFEIHALRVTSIVGMEVFEKHESGRCGKMCIPYFCGVEGNVQFPLDEGDDGTVSHPSEYLKVAAVLWRLARLQGGIHVECYREDNVKRRPPLPDREGLVRIYLWTYPPGESEEEYMKILFDLPLNLDSLSNLMFTGVPGRGVFAGDGKRNAVQLIGNNWYFLFSVIEQFNDLTTIEIFNHSLAAALAVSVSLRKKRKLSVRPSFARKEFLAHAGAVSDRLLGDIERSIDDRRRKIERLRRTLAEEERSLAHEMRVAKDIVRGEERARLIASFPEQWKRIRTHPHVAGLTIEDGGMHILTKPITIVSEGQRYPIGRFTVRIGKKGIISIWSHDFLHPDGHQHPHINADGTLCFGNSGSAIARAVATERYADAVAYLLAWLTEGYDSALTLHKITEWKSEAEPEHSPTPITKHEVCVI